MENNSIEIRLDRIEKLLLSQKTVLTLQEVAEYTCLKPSYLYKLTSKLGIPCYRPNGKQLYFKKDEIDAWLLRNRAKTYEEIKDEATNSQILKG
ncbi:MAG: helix-turn-helix domain-containing protein [Chitinophagales bacterium]|nr:helix-turn-helix domain-containing protein [Chitinophagales bacterium]